MKHFDVWREWCKKKINGNFRQVTNFPWSCHIYYVEEESLYIFYMYLISYILYGESWLWCTNRSNLVIILKKIVTLRKSRHWVYLSSKIVYAFSHFWNSNGYFTNVNEPIPGMFILISMYFSWWFQIMVMKCQDSDIFYKIC